MPAADEAAAREADRVALANCLEKKVLPSLNFSLSKYGASKDRSMRHIVKDVVQRFQPMLKVLPQTVQKQLVEAQAAVAAEASRKKAAKRKRRSEEDGGEQSRQPAARQSRNAAAQNTPTQPSTAQQNGHTAAQHPTGVQRCSAAECSCSTPGSASSARQGPPECQRRQRRSTCYFSQIQAQGSCRCPGRRRCRLLFRLLRPARWHCGQLCAHARAEEAEEEARDGGAQLAACR